MVINCKGPGTSIDRKSLILKPCSAIDSFKSTHKTSYLYTSTLYLQAPRQAGTSLWIAGKLNTSIPSSKYRCRATRRAQFCCPQTVAPMSNATAPGRHTSIEDAACRSLTRSQFLIRQVCYGMNFNDTTSAKNIPHCRHSCSAYAEPGHISETVRSSIGMTSSQKLQNTIVSFFFCSGLLELITLTLDDRTWECTSFDKEDKVPVCQGVDNEVGLPVSATQVIVCQFVLY